MKFLNLALAAASLTFVVSAEAQELPAFKGEPSPAAVSYFTVGANIGTLGPGLELGYRLNSYLGARAGFNWIGYTFNVAGGDNSYGVTANWFNGSALIDFYPFESIFRITGGAHFGRPTVSGHYTPTGFVTVGGVTYSAAEVGRLNADATFSSAALPYVGMGVEGSPFSNNIVLGLDAGVVIFSNPRIKISQSGGTIAVPIAELQADADSFNSNWQKIPVYPVVQLTAKYKF